jgi:hypothetical protein
MSSFVSEKVFIIQMHPLKLCTYLSFHQSFYAARHLVIQFITLA